METIGGFLVLSKRQPGFGEGGDVLIPPAAIVAVEPHRHGSYVYVSGTDGMLPMPTRKSSMPSMPPAGRGPAEWLTEPCRYRHRRP